LSETVQYHDAVHGKHGMKPVQFCESIEWLGPDVWFAHLVKLDDDEIALLGSTQSGIAHCPQSNGRLGSGIAPVRPLEAAGAKVSIGVDGAASNEAADMLSETHAAWLMQRARGGQDAVVASPQRLELHGLDFIATAVKQLEATSSERDLRYALLHLAAGAELLMKSWLLKEHWSLVFEKLDEAATNRLISGKFKTATPDQCIDRLERVVRINISERARGELERLRGLRNRMIHYSMPIDEGDVRALSAGVLSELVDLIRDNCDLEGAEENRLFAELLVALPKLEHYRDRRKDQLRAALAALGENAFLCPTCGDCAVTLEGGRNECLPCLDAFHFSEIQDLHMEKVLNLDAARNQDFGQCPSCLVLGLGRRWPNSEKLFCYHCHEVYTSSQLHVCGVGNEWLAEQAVDRRRACRGAQA